MDDRRFDHLTRFLVQGDQSRRGVLRGLAGAALAATLTLPGMATIAAQNDKPKRCNGRRKIGQKCKRTNGPDCPCLGGAKCTNQGCRCVNGQQESGGKCGRRPSCTPANSGPDSCTDDADCCSNLCFDPDPNPGTTLCVTGGPGDRCLSDDDCQFNGSSDPAVCRGFRCVRV